MVDQILRGGGGVPVAPTLNTKYPIMIVRMSWRLKFLHVAFHCQVELCDKVASVEKCFLKIVL